MSFEVELPKDIQVAVRMNIELKEKLDKLAEEKNTTFSEVARKLIIEGLRKEK